jgi:calmodulin
LALFRIDVWELKSVLEAMGQRPTEDELFSLISEVDSDFSGTINFSEFLSIIEAQKAKATAHNDEQDFIDAFVACGGKPDKSGHVTKETLVKIIKNDFGLTIDIEELIDGKPIVACPQAALPRVRRSPGTYNCCS